MSWSHTPSIVPATYPRSERPHSCGRCRTPWGVSNPDCPNRILDAIEEPWEA